MATDADRRRQPWLSGLGALDWRTEERAYAALLDALTRDRLSVESVEMERQATARRSLADVHQDQERTARDELAEARRELDDFRAALEDAHARSRPDGRQEVPYDARVPEQDQKADLLIQYLVRPGYAEVRTEEVSEGAYVYHVRVDWDRLAELAREHGHPLPL